MAKKTSVAVIDGSYFCFSLSEWKIFEIPYEVYLEMKVIQYPFPSEIGQKAIWVSEETRDELEKWMS